MRRKSPYADVFDAIQAVAETRRLPSRVELETDDVTPSDDLEALDAEWEETAVTFGPSDPLGDCGRSRLMTRLRAAVRSVTDTRAS